MQEDADADEIKKAYRRKSMQWHPDKHAEENRPTATVEFQKIGAAFTKLTQEESDDEDFDFDEMEEFFEEMFARAFGGFPGGSRGGGFGGGFSFGIRIATPGGGYVDIDLDPFADSGYGGYGGGARRSERERYTEPRREPEYYRQYWAEREEAEEQAARVKVKAEQDRATREESDRRSKWLEKLGRLTRLSFTDTSIKLSADTKGTRTAHFPGLAIPTGYYWELQYKPAADKEDYMWIIAVQDGMEVEVTGLQPGTQYMFRARTCVRLPDGTIKCGEWSVEHKTATSGVAPKKTGSGGRGGEAAAVNGSGNADGSGSSKSAQKRAAKKKAAAEMKQQQQLKLEEEAAAAAKAAAEKEREEKLKAVMKAAAADYASATNQPAASDASTTNAPGKSSVQHNKKQGKKKKGAPKGASNVNGVSSAAATEPFSGNSGIDSEVEYEAALERRRQELEQQQQDRVRQEAELIRLAQEASLAEYAAAAAAAQASLQQELEVEEQSIPAFLPQQQHISSDDGYYNQLSPDKQKTTTEIPSPNSVQDLTAIYDEVDDSYAAAPFVADTTATSADNADYTAATDTSYPPRSVQRGGRKPRGGRGGRGRGRGRGGENFNEQSYPFSTATVPTVAAPPPFPAAPLEQPSWDADHPPAPEPAPQKPAKSKKKYVPIPMPRASSYSTTTAAAAPEPWPVQQEEQQEYEEQPPQQEGKKKKKKPRNKKKSNPTQQENQQQQQEEELTWQQQQDALGAEKNEKKKNPNKKPRKPKAKRSAPPQPDYSYDADEAFMYTSVPAPKIPYSDMAPQAQAAPVLTPAQIETAIKGIW